MEIFSNGSCSFEISLAENRGNWKSFDKYFCFSMKTLFPPDTIFAQKFYNFSSLQILNISTSDHVWMKVPPFRQSKLSSLHFSIALDMSSITHFCAEIINPKILLAETF